MDACHNYVSQKNRGTALEVGPRPLGQDLKLDLIYSFGDIAIFMLCSLGLKLPIYVVVSVAHAQNEALIYFWGRN